MILIIIVIFVMLIMMVMIVISITMVMIIVKDKDDGCIYYVYIQILPLLAFISIYQKGNNIKNGLSA